MRPHHLAVLSIALLLCASSHAATVWDTRPDTWVATDDLGRAVPGRAQVGPPRPGKTVGIFYFLWMGQHGTGGPYDISKILAQDPDADNKPESPLWGPVGAFHHWGESEFGYYLSDDPYVFRKHAQMLADAGVDTLIFDVTNGFTYTQNYLALCKTFEEVRKNGGRTPQIAFLCPFGAPTTVLPKLYNDLYKPGLYRDLWFRWEGKPLVMADENAFLYEEFIGGTPDPVELRPGHTLGQTFTTPAPITGVGAPFPTWTERNSEMTLALRRNGPEGPLLAEKHFADVPDNEMLMLRFPEPLPKGTYYLEMRDPKGRVGWWTRKDDAYKAGTAMEDGKPVPGDRNIWLDRPDNPYKDIADTFTFRKPMPSYFAGPSAPRQWGWLEVYPQHAFYAKPGVPEEVTVGIGQNAVDGQLSVMSNPRAHGRSFHNGQEPPPSGRDYTGRNVQEQWRRALQLDPSFIFLTGWNEWVAMRFNIDNPFFAPTPVTFVDTYNEEFSRDIEPMKGGHADLYYYQMVSYIRRYKGVRAPEPAGPPAKIAVDGKFKDWASVRPEYRDDIGDAINRDHPGWGGAGRYVNTTGRNDFAVLKVARDAKNLAFYARTKNPITAIHDPLWMNLYLDTDAGAKTGRHGYDFRIRAASPRGRTLTMEKWAINRWKPVATVPFAVAGNEMELSIPRKALGLASNKPVRVDFKWTDNIDPADPLNYYRNGDTAPNERFSYRYEPSAVSFQPAARKRPEEE